MRRTQAREGLPLLTIGTSSRCLSLSVSNGVLWIPTSFVLNLSTHLLPRSLPFTLLAQSQLEPCRAAQREAEGWEGGGVGAAQYLISSVAQDWPRHLYSLIMSVRNSAKLVVWCHMAKQPVRWLIFFFPPNCCVDTDSNLMVRFIEPLLQRAHLKKFFF